MPVSSADSSVQKMELDLHRAAREGQYGLLTQYLTSTDASPEEIKQKINAKDADQRTVLHWILSGPPASESGLNALRTLIQVGADVDSRDESGWTPLMSASSAGSADYVQLLIESGASPTATNTRGLTPLHYAASKGHTDVGRILLENGALVNARDGAKQTPMHRAATAGKDAFVRVLLKPPPRKDGQAHEKTRVNPQDRLNNTPLHLAMDSGHGSTAVLLIEEGGADRERTNEDGLVPEEIDGLGGQEQARVRSFVKSSVGPR
ncbi:putative ankyrin-repeat protein [Tilletia horrida]|nr:putative ankyrin-repeat protein [Tilletia horrida]KAK0568187.1 putative ankyrin-repeat protein [Tilletia horrida]